MQAGLDPEAKAVLVKFLKEQAKLAKAQPSQPEAQSSETEQAEPEAPREKLKPEGQTVEIELGQRKDCLVKEPTAVQTKQTTIRTEAMEVDGEEPRPQKIPKL